MSQNSLGNLISDMLGYKTIRIELTEIEAIKGKAVRLNINNNEKVLIVDVPRGVKKNQSFYLFYLLDDNNKNNTSFKF